MSLSELVLPDDVVQQTQTREFCATDFPEPLRSDHSTKAGVWGLLTVTAGAVTFRDQESNETREIAAGQTQVILPEAVHSAEPNEDARCFIQFFRAPTAEGVETS